MATSPVTHAPQGTPISERPRDWFFVIAFSFFAFSSFFSDSWHALGLLHGDGFWPEANRWYAEVAGDEFFKADHKFVRVNTGISGMIYGPFYLFLDRVQLKLNLRKNFVSGRTEKHRIAHRDVQKHREELRIIAQEGVRLAEFWIVFKLRRQWVTRRNGDSGNASRKVSSKETCQRI